jgi:uncharacterized protein (TIGR02118 family)
MTVKLVALWTKPDDAEGFDKDYEATHAILVAKLPGMSRAVLSKAIADGPYHRMAELIFDDAGGMGAALGSPEGAELLGDAGRLSETFGNKVDVLTVEEQP